MAVCLVSSYVRRLVMVSLVLVNVRLELTYKN
jgi:hypothetical protein